jgi:CheY-like chemotaxis protein
MTATLAYRSGISLRDPFARAGPEANHRFLSPHACDRRRRGQGLAATVRRDGYRVIEGTDGETALALAREWHRDVVTLDVLMPRMDGWAVLTALKSDPELAEIPVIIVTVLADRAIAVSLGAAEFLTKPVDRARLAATLRQHVYGSGVILVVDDESESRDLARRHLDRLGWEVAEAEDG